jgi:hypothetical protein
MKNIIFAVFFALILAGFTAFGQASQLITHIDTLQSEDVIVTLTDSQGNLINKGLAGPGFVFQNDTTDMVFPTGGSDENPDGSYVDNIDLPGSDGGFLPQDVVYNTHNSKYYIYGFRKIMVCDANMQPVKTIDISNVDGFSSFYSDYHERRIFVHPTQNIVYGMTINGALFSIDQYYNLQTLTEPIGDYLIERSSMIYRESDNTILYYFYVETTLTTKTLLYKYSINNSQLTTNEISGIISYDIDAINFEASYKILVSTNQGIKVFSSSLQLENPFYGSYKFDHIAVMNNLIFAHQTEPNNSLLVLNAAGSLIQELQLNYSNARFAFPDPTNNKLYLSGYSSSSSGIDIIRLIGSQWMVQNCAYQNIFGLSENSTQIIGCGKVEVVFINKQTGNHTSISSTSIGQMYRVATGSSINTAIAAQPLNGNVLKISSTGTQILETGGNISGVCRKGDKIYMAVNKFNNKGYILVLNASSGAVIDRVTPSFEFNPVDVFCLDDENVVNDRIYVHYVIPDGTSVLGKLMAFKINDPFSIDEAETSFGNVPLEYLVSPNGSVFIGERNVACGCYVYFYNWDLTQKEVPFYCLGCVKEFDFISEKNYFVFTSMCDSRIYFFQDGEHDISELDNCDIPHPHSFVYNSDEEIGYCFKSDEGGNNFYTVDLETFTANPFPAYPGLTLVEELFYNPNDDLVYGISEQKVYIIGNGSILGSYNLDAGFDITGFLNRDDDYIFDEIRNKLYLPVTNESGYLNSKKILALDLQNGNNTILSCDLSYQKSALVLFPTDKYSLFGKTLTYYPTKQNIYCAQMYFSNASIITTHTETRSFRGDWNWLSYPCMPRLGNASYSSRSLLENINPLPEEFTLQTRDGGQMKYLYYNEPYWDTAQIPNLISTHGYKYYSTPIMTQNLQVTGVVLDPSTPIPLNSAYENWIGYFIEYPLMPQAAFAGIWDKLTRITTRNWTMFKINGQWFSSTRITPIKYGDGLIVTVSENCQLVWNYVSAPSEDYSFPPTAYYSYEEKAEYTPFYFEMNSTNDVKEIGLTVNDSCVGAAVVEPGDSIVEVNAYLTGTQSGLPIEVENWSGFKSAKLSPDKYSVVDPATRKRISRKVYTGEHKAYYILSFKSGETSKENPVALLQPASPNPFNSETQLSFVLNRQANVSLTVHDLQGNTIKTLLRGNYPEGLYDAGWTGTDTSEKQVENGVYIIRLTVDDKMIKNEKVVLIK